MTSGCEGPGELRLGTPSRTVAWRDQSWLDEPREVAHRALDPEAASILEPELAIRANVEQQLVPPVSYFGSKQYREAVTAVAKLVETAVQACPPRCPGRVRSASAVNSATCGMPGVMLESVSVSLSITTTSSSSSSCWMSCRAAGMHGFTAGPRTEN